VYFLNPRLFRLHAAHQIELGIALDFLCEDNNTDTTAIEGTCSERSSTTDTTGTKVDSIRYALGTEKVRVEGGGDGGWESMGELASGEGCPRLPNVWRTRGWQLLSRRGKAMHRTMG
jgi:hypothetical protein